MSIKLGDLTKSELIQLVEKNRFFISDRDIASVKWHGLQAKAQSLRQLSIEKTEPKNGKRISDVWLESQRIWDKADRVTDQADELFKEMQRMS